MMIASSFETFLPAQSPERKNQINQSWSFRGARVSTRWWDFLRWISGQTSALPSFHLFPAAAWDFCFTDLKFPLVLQPEVQGRSCICASPFTLPGDLPGAWLYTRMQSGAKFRCYVTIPMVQGPCRCGILFPTPTSAGSGPFKCRGD